MFANSDRNCPLLRRLLTVASAVALSCSLPAVAQTAHTSDLAADAQGSSSSALYQASLNTDELLGGSSSPYHFSLAAANGSPQYGGRRTTVPRLPQLSKPHEPCRHRRGRRVLPAPSATIPMATNTWGYNLDFGGGWNFSKKFGIVFEYQFDRSKIPGATIAAVGAQGGNINSHLFLFDPIYYFYSGKSSGRLRHRRRRLLPQGDQLHPAAVGAAVLLLLLLRVCSGHGGALLQHSGRSGYRPGLVLEGLWPRQQCEAVC